jgi:hypothetical protein
MVVDFAEKKDEVEEATIMGKSNFRFKTSDWIWLNCIYNLLCPKFNLETFLINFNGTIVAQDTNILTQNRAFCTECSL